MMPFLRLARIGLFPDAVALSQAIEGVKIIPLSSVLVDIIKAAEEFKELDEAIIRNFDTILLTTMDIIYKLHTALKESPFGDASRQTRL